MKSPFNKMKGDFMLFIFLKRINANAGLFNGHFVDVKAFYVWKFNEVPCITLLATWI
jgi:hypothetical protein